MVGKNPYFWTFILRSKARDFQRYDFFGVSYFNAKVNSNIPGPGEYVPILETKKMIRKGIGAFLSTVFLDIYNDIGI